MLFCSLISGNCLQYCCLPIYRNILDVVMKDNLKEGIEAAKTGKPAEAQYYLKKAINQNPNDVTALLWLAYVVDDPRKQKIA